MRSSHLVFLSLGTVVAGFSFTGLPSTATVNIATSGTLIRDSSDPTAFSLLLRLVTQNGGSTIQTFNSEEETSIPFTFTPTESGSFIIEVISNLTPISDTTEPDQIFASSSEFTVSEPDNQASPPSITSSSSENAGTSSSSQNVNTVTSSSSSTAVQTTTTANNNNGQGESTSTSTSTTSLQTSSTHSTSAAVAGAASSTNAASVTTNAFASQSTGTSAKGALGSASGSPTATSSSGTPSDSSDTSGSGSSNGSPPVSKSTITSPPGSTGTLAPNSAASKSTNTGMIVGIILGVLAFVAVSMALLLAFIRRRRRQRTNTFKRQLMTRQTRSSPLVFNMVSPPPSTTAESGDGFCEYNLDLDNGDILETGTVAQSDMSYRQSAYSNPEMMETGTVAHTDLSHIQSMYSEPSVNSMYSDSPSIFYTAVPRTTGAGSAFVANPPPTPPPSMPPPPAPVAPSALGLTFSPPSGSAPSSHPQLAPGWVFPRTPARASQLPPPKTERQMDIYDRKVRLQGKLISLQGWGNVDAPASQQNEVQMLKEQIRRLELLENSDWAMGKSNELPSLT